MSLPDAPPRQDPRARPDAARAFVPPAAAVRGESWLARADQAAAWCDGWLGRFLPPELNPLAQAGRAANFVLLVAVVSGVALLAWYSPSVQTAHASLAALEGWTVGGWVRAVHRYSSDLVMLLVLLHALRMTIARKFAGARWVAWVSGIGLLALIWLIGWTGYWLVWDQPAQQVAVSSMSGLDALPIFGEPLTRAFLIDRTVPSLLFFVVFFLHMLLPLGIAVGLAVHLLRLSRVRLLPEWRLNVALTLGVGLAALLVPAPLDAPAAMAVKAEHFTVDAWYLAPLALGLRLQQGGLWLALLGTGLCAAALPWILGRRRPKESFQAVVEPSRCHACTQCVQDCPFDAITMVARTDGKRFPSQAQVDPARCVGCGVCAGSCDSEGISLPWFATARQEARIEQMVTANGGRGVAPYVALVPGDADSVFGLLAHTRWRERLPGYEVHLVPTASWVRPVLVERLLHRGVRGVFIVRDARAEAAARDGNRWVAARMAGERSPVFRPQRAGQGGRWAVVDYDPSRPVELTRAAAGFAVGHAPSVVKTSAAQRVLVVILLAVAIGAAVVAPSHLVVSNPVAPHPEFIFSFKAYGEVGDVVELDPVAQAHKPVHMRGRVTEKPRRAPVVVRLTLNGRQEERIYAGKGWSHDGPAIDEWRLPLSVGPQEIAVEVESGDGPALQRWQGVVEAKPRRLHVLTYEPQIGFQLE